MHLGLGLFLGQQGGGGVALPRPADIVLEFDISNLGTLWVDVAATAPAEVGDQVARVDDARTVWSYMSQNVLTKQGYLRFSDSPIPRVMKKKSYH